MTKHEDSGVTRYQPSCRASSVGVLSSFALRPSSFIAVWLLVAASSHAGERTQRFDADPGWEGVNNRATVPDAATVRQDFGYSAQTLHAGGQRGEIGGFIMPDGEPAYYAKPLDESTFQQPLAAKGKLNCTGRHFHALLGFFNAGTVNEWRNPNAVMLRLYGRGEVVHVHVEYATSRWRAGAAVVTEQLPANTAHEWSLRYDPRGGGGNGSITAKVGPYEATCTLEDGHKSDGATFNRFGLLTVVKSVDTGGEIWIDDVVVNGQPDAGADWEGVNNRRTYRSVEVRPRFDFGFSPTQFAGGSAPGELGGLVIRGDIRAGKDGRPFEGSRMASYGDRLHRLTLVKPLAASGRMALRRAVSDSTVLLGFYDSKRSVAADQSRTDLQASGFPEHFIGVVIEGPSREGFYFYPAYRMRGDMQAHGVYSNPPRIYPDGASHHWSMRYEPRGADEAGVMLVTLGDKSVELKVDASHKAAGAMFDRFGIVTTWIDGNGQRVYFDDLTYTVRQE